MRILVISDSHGKEELVDEICKTEAFDICIFLGDGRAEDISSLLPSKVAFYSVRGNCDLFSNKALNLTLSVEGNHIYASHGSVSRTGNKEILFNDAIANQLGGEPSIILYGHTHLPSCEFYKGALMLNPGALKNGCYALLEIKQKNFTTKLKKLEI